MEEDYNELDEQARKVYVISLSKLEYLRWFEMAKKKGTLHYGMIDKDGKIVAIFKDEVFRDLFYNTCIKPFKKDYARIKVEDGFKLT